jgi:hypothetical protein
MIHGLIGAVSVVEIVVIMMTRFGLILYWFVLMVDLLSVRLLLSFESCGCFELLFVML